MPKNPLVTVIMPAYNAAGFIQQAIESVLCQTVSDLELLVIDDGSADETRQTVEQLCARDCRVHLLINEKNRGAGGTRNRGLELSKSPYTALLDSDDYWHPRLLERLIGCLENTGADVSYCSYELVDEAGKKVCNDFIVPDKTDFEHCAVRNVLSCSSVVFARTVVDRYRFPANVYHEDIALWLQMLRDGIVARGVPEVLAAYRQRADSKTAGKLKSAVRRWSVYRGYLGLSVWKSAGFMARYALYGLQKYKRI